MQCDSTCQFSVRSSVNKAIPSQSLRSHPQRTPRITIQFYRDKNGVIRGWNTGAKASLPARHVLLVDYRHGGIFDTWKSGGGRNYDLVKRLDANPGRRRRRR